MLRSQRLALLALAGALSATTLSCGSREGDPPSNRGVPPPTGTDAHIRDVGDPNKEGHPKDGDTVAVSGAAVVALDTYDETANGKSTGTLYIQDVGSQEPYSGIGVFAPSFVPGNLTVGPGDVLDLRGEYQENANIGSAEFAPGVVFPQLAFPVATFRYEYEAPEPVVIDLADLADWDKGRRWLGMLVKVKDVELHSPATRDAVQKSGRLSANLLAPVGATACEAPFPKTPTLTNELFDLASADLPAGTKLKSITGVVVFFCNLHLAPRSAADLER